MNSTTLSQALRAASLLTGSTECAEHAVVLSIAGLDSRADLEDTLVTKTIQSVIRHRQKFPDQFQKALALLPRELQWLIHLTPVSRSRFVLRLLLGITPANCAASLSLTIEEFEESVRAAFVQLLAVGAMICSPNPIRTEVTQ